MAKLVERKPTPEQLEEHAERAASAGRLFRECMFANEIGPSATVSAMMQICAILIETSGLSYEKYCEMMDMCKRKYKEMWD